MNEVAPPCSAPASVIVVGGGIAGLSTALFLGESGFAVTLIEGNEQVAMETSYMNGSLVCPSLTPPWCSKSNLWGFANQTLISRRSEDNSIVILWDDVLKNRNFWIWILHFVLNSVLPGKHTDLFRISYELSKYSIGVMQSLELDNEHYKGNALGTIQLFPTSQAQQQQFKALSSVVQELVMVPSERVVSYCPVLKDPTLFPGGAIVSDLDRSYDIHEYCLTLKKRAESTGVKFILGKQVNRLECDENMSGSKSNNRRVDRIRLQDGTLLSADAYVIAAGNHSNVFAQLTGDGCHSWPVRGFALEVPVAKDQQQLNYNVVDDPRRVYIAPLQNDAVRLSGFCELGALYPDKNKPVDFSVATRLLDQARQLLPKGYLVPSDHPNIKRHTCWRPQTPDDLPVIGRSSKVSNLYYNSGHGHLGLTRAVGSSKLLVDSMVGSLPAPAEVGWMQKRSSEIDLSPFRPNRFNSLLSYLPKFLSRLK